MNTFTMVRPEHLNHHGYLFGGSMLKWVDEYAWLVAARDFPGCTLVTRGMDRIVFSKQVKNGSILRFSILPWKQGNTSVTYAVEVHADSPGAMQEELVFSTHVTFVRIDEDGHKTALPKRETYRSMETS
ncbi:acyl-CoA thioesterase [Desulfoplanes formicivorans]|uniref:Thioesterase n=1 Tax=Desulfoplanes formicivorans TaxID=1592317 RepID=A0A194AHJ2_9BACT|nr:hotdog domain-containing protein [Desulfoplanes formicivorans]GAU08551.1 thioesterase [Desulfoplanes formicivorans]